VKFIKISVYTKSACEPNRINLIPSSPHALLFSVFHIVRRHCAVLLAF